MFDYAERRRHLGERMESEGIDILFLAPSADLEYLTGVERDIPNFGEASYAHGWVAGAFFRPGAEPVFVFPRMFVAFHLQQNLPDGELVVVNETDGGPAIFDRIARVLGATGAGSTVGTLVCEDVRGAGATSTSPGSRSSCSSPARPRRTRT